MAQALRIVGFGWLVLFLLSIISPNVTSLRLPKALNMSRAPYVDFLFPKHGQCYPAGGEIVVAWKLIFATNQKAGEAFMARHATSGEVCIAVGLNDALHCVSATGAADFVLDGLGDGCHTLAAWWQDKNTKRDGRDLQLGVSGAAMSIAVVVGSACDEGCSAAPGSLIDAYVSPPNSITGGDLGVHKNVVGGEKVTSSIGHTLKRSQRCLRGCCEATIPFSLCVHGRSAAAQGTSTAEPLPFCSECMIEISPPQLELLPRYQDSAGLTQRYLRLVRETVLHSAFEGPMEVGGSRGWMHIKSQRVSSRAV